MSTAFHVAFFVFLVLHACHSLLEGRRRRRAQALETGDTPIGDDAPARRFQPVVVLVHGPLFILSCYYAFEMGAFSRDLISPLYISVGLVLGHLIFALSLGFIHGSLREGYELFADVRDLWRFMWDSPYVLTRFLSVSIGEEIIWRVAAQTLIGAVTGSATAGIVAAAVLFSVCHDHFFSNTRRVSLEFVLFALLLGGLYHMTGSLILVIVVHAMRDIEIAYLEYCAKVAEYGSRDKAADHIEQLYATPGVIRT